MCLSHGWWKNIKERSKYTGLLRKMQSWFFVSETCLLKDALRCLKQLSLYLQSRDANIMNAGSHVADTIAKLQALKKGIVKVNKAKVDAGDDDDDADEIQSVSAKVKDDTDDDDGNETQAAIKDVNDKNSVTTLSKFWDSYAVNGHYKGVKIEKEDADEKRFENFSCQFLQSLCDNLQQRFPTTNFLQAASCLNVSSLPKNRLKLALFGEKHVASLCKQFGLTIDEAADIVLDYAMFKQSKCTTLGHKLQSLISLLKILPVSSAECQMNLYHSSGRNRLAVMSVSDMLMIGINGPPIAVWNANKYVISWLKSGKHCALDKATSLPKAIEVPSYSSKLFA